MPENAEEKPEEKTTPESQIQGPVEKGEGEEEPEKPETAGGLIGNILSPEGIMMLLVAIALDLASLVLLCFALDDFFTLDIIGIIIIGTWIYFRSQVVKMTKGAAARMRKKVGRVAPKEMGKAAQWAKRMKWLRPLLVVGELIPYVGNAPCWTLLVIFELKT